MDDDNTPIPNRYYFIIFDDGGTGWALSDVAPALTRPGEYVSYNAYKAAYTAVKEANYQQTLTGLEADVVRSTQTRDAYVTLGVPVAVANGMSGYTATVNARDQWVADHDGLVAVNPTPAEVAAVGEGQI